MHRVFCSLGSNQGDRLAYIQNGVKLLLGIGCENVTSSGVYETKAWGLKEQPDFLNICLGLDTELEAYQFLDAIIQIERQLGRQREIKWGPRTLDIDILLYDEVVLKEDILTIPHPYMQVRKFVIMPLAELAPNVIHPVLNKSIAVLNNVCPDEDLPVLIGKLFS